MKNSIFIFALIALAFVSCKKETDWDAALNGKWQEVTTNNLRALPSNCDIIFDYGVMVICGESIGKQLNQKSEVNAHDGQVWISYKLSFRKHEEYRYDYQFEGGYLWIMEETTTQSNRVVNNPNAKKYRKL